jgi:hypothetical protein
VHKAQPDRKEHCQAEPNCAPKQRFTKRNDVSAPMKDAEIEGQDDENENDKADPMPNGDFYDTKH